MLQRRNAVKALRVQRKRFERNLGIKHAIKKTVKKFKGLVSHNNLDEAKNVLKTLYKQFDKAAKVKLLHKNTAARRKSHFSHLIATSAPSK